MGFSGRRLRIGLEKSTTDFLFNELFFLLCSWLALASCIPGARVFGGAAFRAFVLSWAVYPSLGSLYLVWLGFGAVLRGRSLAGNV